MEKDAQSLNRGSDSLELSPQEVDTKRTSASAITTAQKLALKLSGGSDDGKHENQDGTEETPHVGGTHAAGRDILLSIQDRGGRLMPPDRQGFYYHLPSPVAVDIGGTLAKMAYFRPPNPPALPSYVNVEKHFYKAGDQLPVKPDQSLEVDLSHGFLGGVLKFLKFPSRNVTEFIDFILSHKLHAGYGGTEKMKSISATGGGAYKYRDIVKKKLGIDLVPRDEMRAMIRGLNFLLRNTNNEIFTFNKKTKRKEFIEYDEGEVFPYLLVSCGSGVSILRVDDDDKFERVSGSAIGGATFYGLCRLLTGLDSFEDIQLHGFSGDHRKVDLLVGDIYGGAYPQFGLAAKTVASHFGKAATKFPRPANNFEEDTPSVTHRRRSHSSTASSRSREHNKLQSSSPPSFFSSRNGGLLCDEGEELSEGQDDFEKADTVQALMFMVCSNIAQLAFLNARHYGLTRVFFSGGFVRNNPLLWNRLSSSIDYWSKGDMKAYFLLHDGYLGALGSLIWEAEFTKGDHPAKATASAAQQCNGNENNNDNNSHAGSEKNQQQNSCDAQSDN